MRYWYYVNGTKSTRGFETVLQAVEAVPRVHIERGAEVVVEDTLPGVACKWCLLVPSPLAMGVELVPVQDRPKTVKGIDPIMYNIYFRDVTPGPEDDDEPEESCGEVFIDYHCEDFQEVVSMVREWGQGYWSDSQVTLHTCLTTDMGTVDYRTGRSRTVDIFSNNERSLRYLKKAAKVWGVK